MALLHALHALAPEFGWKLSVAHFNHRLRGRSSAADERLVRATAKRLELPCDVASAKVRVLAAKRGISVEMAGRELRHAFFAKCAQRRRVRVVVLAHHADDQVELFFLRLLRGAGAEGLGGMKPRNRSSAGRRVELVRPFLDFNKEEIVSYVREARLAFRHDASNASVDFDRNWIRLKLLPLLRERQPAVDRTVLRAMQVAGAEAEVVGDVAAAWMKSGMGSQAFARLPVAVQRRVIQSQLCAMGVDCDFQRIETLRLEPRTKISVGPGFEVLRESDGRVRRVLAPATSFSRAEKVIELSSAASTRGWATIDLGTLKLNWRMVLRKKAFSPQRQACREFFDADRVGGHMVLRHWRAGDRFQPIGLPSATKLQDWFTNRKIPSERRRKLILAETERGEVFWVEGERIGEVAKVTPATRRLLEFKWKPV